MAKKEKEVYKVIKTWYFKATDLMDAKEKARKLKDSPDEIKISNMKYTLSI